VIKQNHFNGAVAFETDKKTELQRMTATTEGLRPLLLFGLVDSFCSDSCLLTSFCSSCQWQHLMLPLATPDVANGNP